MTSTILRRRLARARYEAQQLRPANPSLARARQGDADALFEMLKRALLQEMQP